MEASALRSVEASSRLASESEIWLKLPRALERLPCWSLMKPVSSSMLLTMPFRAVRFSSTVRSSVREVLSRFSIVRWMLSKALGRPCVALSWKTVCRLRRISSTPAMSWSVRWRSGMSSCLTDSAMPISISDGRVSPTWASSTLRPAMRSMALVPNRSLETIRALVSSGSCRLGCSMRKVTWRAPEPRASKSMAATCPTLKPLTTTGLDTASPSMRS